MQKHVDGMLDAESQYCPMGDWRLSELAREIHEGEVFGSWMVRPRDRDLLHHIFITLSLMRDFERKKMKRDGIVHFYGYIRDQLGRSMEGYPCFTRVHLIDRADSMRLMRHLKDIERETHEHAIQSC